MNEDLKMIEKNDTWELVLRLERRNVIGLKWVYRAKLNSDSSLNKLKVRLVMKGYAQQLGMDYDHTFASVMRHDTV